MMSSIEFKAFPKIERFDGFGMSITQKIHGTNAHILIKDGWILGVGSRTRWLTVEDDNYGFCKYVTENAKELIAFLGDGHHFGEWAGHGINSGEGLVGRKFVLFDWRRHQKNLTNAPMPEGVAIVPVLVYSARFSDDLIKETMKELKEKGSRLVDGFMRTEGVVIDINRTLYKKVFDKEETKWDKPGQVKKTFTEVLDVSNLLQPIRMEKVMSRNESNITGFPKTLPIICKDYVQDLKDEGEITPSSEDEEKAIMKELGRHVFSLAKDVFVKKFQGGEGW